MTFAGSRGLWQRREEKVQKKERQKDMVPKPLKRHASGWGRRPFQKKKRLHGSGREKRMAAMLQRIDGWDFRNANDGQFSGAEPLQRLSPGKAYCGKLLRGH